MFKRELYFIKRYGLIFSAKLALKQFGIIVKRFFLFNLKNSSALISIKTKTNNPKILFIANNYDFSSQRYRVQNIQEYLKLQNIENELLYTNEINKYRDYALTFNIIVFFRIPYDQQLAGLLASAKKLKIITIYSLDDLIFNNDSLEKYLKLSLPLTGKEKNFYSAQANSYKKILSACDYFLGTTEYLTKEADKLGKKSFIIRNGLNNLQMSAAKKALKPINGKQNLIIGYITGTKTHEYDFKMVEDALIKILREYPHVQLRIVGFLDLSDKFNNYKNQIKKISFTHWKKLLYEIAKVDINIAPLETGNPIVESKSELKYFEAGLLKIPTIASATDAFKFAITNGENGFLAYNENDWYKYLKMLIEDPELRQKIGENAYKHTMSNYAPEPMSLQTKKVFEEIYNDYWNNKK